MADPRDADALRGYADLLWDRGLVARAGQAYIRSLAIRPDDLPALLGLGRVALQKRLIPISMDVYGRATRVAPRSAEAWVGMGRAYYLQSLNIAGALDAYTRAATLAPTRTDFFADWYQALRVGFRPEEGETLLRRRLAAAPGDHQCRFLLARHLLENDATPRATGGSGKPRSRLFSQRRTAQLRFPPYGRLLVESGRFAEAIPYLEEALYRRPV